MLVSQRFSTKWPWEDHLLKNKVVGHLSDKYQQEKDIKVLVKVYKYLGAKYRF